VVAKDAPTREALKALFARHAIEREYLALVVGTPVERTIETRYARNGIRFTSRVTEGRHAVTHARVLERFRAASNEPGTTLGRAVPTAATAGLVACSLSTGRTHQIRVHLSEQLGTPILGDTLYGGIPKLAFLAALARELGHPALHARLLGFVHPATGKSVSFEQPVPADFAACLARLRAWS
jgi:23S rRNA pseudouridine1911/1915/1917 synthase